MRRQTPMKKCRKKFSPWPKSNYNRSKIWKGTFKMEVTFEDVSDENTSGEEGSWNTPTSSESSDTEDDVFKENLKSNDANRTIYRSSEETTEKFEEDDDVSSPETMRKERTEENEVWSVDHIVHSDSSSSEEDTRKHTKKILHSTKRENSGKCPVSPYIEEYINFSSIYQDEESIIRESKLQSDAGNCKSYRKKINLQSTRNENDTQNSLNFEELNLSSIHTPEVSCDREPEIPSDTRRKTRLSREGDVSNTKKNSRIEMGPQFNTLKTVNVAKERTHIQEKQLKARRKLFQTTTSEKRLKSQPHINIATENNEYVASSNADCNSQRSQKSLVSDPYQMISSLEVTEKNASKSQRSNLGHTKRKLPVSPYLEEPANLSPPNSIISLENNENTLISGIKSMHQPSEKTGSLAVPSEISSRKVKSKKASESRKRPHLSNLEEPKSMSSSNVNENRGSKENVSPYHPKRKSKKYKKSNFTDKRSQETSKHKHKKKHVVKQDSSLSIKIYGEPDEEVKKKYYEYMKNMPIDDLSLKSRLTKQ